MQTTVGLLLLIHRSQANRLACVGNKICHLNNINQINFVFTRVTHNSHTTDKPVALEFPIELEFRNVDFFGGRKTGESGEKPSEQGREPTKNSTHL